jgi:UDP-N-acetylmuramoylalanine--D-glutamate ligase
MVEVTNYRDLRVGVFGLGKTGISSIYSLSSGGSNVIAWDDDIQKRNSWLGDSRPQFIALSMHKTLTDITDPNWRDIAALVLSPGIPLNFPKPHRVVELAREHNKPIICDIELLYLTCCSAKYIGITGTNGKSTTTSLIGHILKQAEIKAEIGGNIGVAALDLPALSSDGCYVIELSSFQLDLLEKTKFNIAILLNITKDHIDHHGNMENYIAAKSNIFRNQNQNDTAIIGIDNAFSKAIYQQLVALNQTRHIIPISAKERLAGGVCVTDNVIYNDINGSNSQYICGELKHLKGQHNAENIAAAFAACFIQDIAADKIVAGIKSFPGLKHRQELVAELNGVSFINDSKGTNAEATEKALLSFDNIYWIVGGRAKDGGIEVLTPLFNKIKFAFLIGEASEQFAAIFAANNVPYSNCHQLATATDQAANMAFADNNHPNVLLSPACASWDQWDNFEQRGEAFCSYVAAIKLKLGL